MDDQVFVANCASMFSQFSELVDHQGVIRMRYVNLIWRVLETGGQANFDNFVKVAGYGVAVKAQLDGLQGLQNEK